MSSPLSLPAGARLRAVLVGVQLPELSDDQVEASLDELARLCTTLGLDPVARITQRRPSIGAATVLGAGKLRELAQLTGGRGAVPSPVPSWRRRRSLEASHSGPEEDPEREDAGGDGPDTPQERMNRAFGESIVSQKPLDEVVLEYLVENARKRKRRPR